MLQTSSSHCDLEVSVGQFLPVMGARPQRIVVGLHQPMFQHGESDGVFGVVLIPSTVASLPEASLCYRGNRDYFEAFLEQTVSQRAGESGD